MAAINVLRLIQESDRILSRLDSATASRMKKELLNALKGLEDEFRARYSLAKTALKEETALNKNAIAEARARAIILELKTALKAFDLGSSSSKSLTYFEDSIYKAYENGIKGGKRLLKAFAPSLDFTVGVNLDAVAAVLENSAQRLSKHHQDFIAKAQTSVIQSLIRGEGVGVAAKRLREATGILNRQALTIVRTEHISALDDGRRESYKANGVEYVQRIATQDNRVCPYCAERAGHVYPLSDAPASLHPSDRCYNLPWKLEWFELGLVDVPFFEQHSKNLTAELKTRGLEPNGGKAPFEDANGQDKPKALWTPTSGFTSFGKRELGL
jgi:SPP1 gp7 family putative phage head morphogenesis protein